MLHRTLLTVAVAAALFAPVVAQEGGGPADYIEARKSSMQAIEGLLSQLEADLASATITGSQMAVSTEAIAAALETFPLLFPEPVASEAAAAPPSSADPKIWEEIVAFSSLSRTAAEVAREAAKARPEVSLPKVRETCATCHEGYVFYDPFASMPIGPAGQ